MTEIEERQAVQRQVEVIITRQLAGYLALPIIVIDPWGTVVYYNEPAERLLGRRFDEAGPIPSDDWSRVFELTYESGEAMPVTEMPLIAALRTRRPAQRAFWMRGLDGVLRHLDGTGIPLLAEGDRFLGAFALFWEMSS